jgi:Na+/H+ antiporter NhaA
MFGFTLHARNRCHFLFHKHVFGVFLSHFSTKKKKKNWGEDAEFLFFFLLIAFQILHVFLPDILVHCELIKYAYI